jgi:threonine/homoserine/homoserine lactone efflux protein
VGVAKLVLGALLVLVALQQWRGRPRGGAQAQLPRWMQAIDTFTPGRAVAMGVALSAINPKNLILTLGAAGAIAQTGIETGEQAVALAVFSSWARSVRACRWRSTSRSERAPGTCSTTSSCGWRATTRRSWPCSAW